MDIKSKGGRRRHDGLWRVCAEQRLKMTSDLQLGQFALATGPVFTFLALNQFLSVTLGFLQH